MFEETMLDIMDAITEMSYQRFKLTRKLSKLGLIASVIYFVRGFILMATFPGEIDPAAPELMPFLDTLNFADFMVMVIFGIIFMMSLSCYLAMSQGKNNHDRYKAWCEANYYEPYNASKH